MRAPAITVRRHLHRHHIGIRVHLSDGQWGKIEKSLTDAGADVGAARALRSKIENWAREHSLLSRLRYNGSRKPPPKQRVKQLRREIRDLDVASRAVARHLPGLPSAWRALKAVREEAERELQEKAAPKPRRQRIASKSNRPYPYTDYMTALTPLWQAIVPNGSHKQLRAFLRACIELVFPTVLHDSRTGKPTDNALNSFTERVLPSIR